ncbi:hypothetical protein C8N47_11674 [Mangrovibacterium marinum]|uniref:Glycosyl hydrolase family 32 n=1 Tax=Mangrovibacterium marinum TaxID=1639118 RepID=A0A2T5BZ74_9BACT|nr:hypothetical protein [Mangrovibacterium marinum]PTN07549.1 hypothetical protein C8N47_11674 [Mangrovibacterium marinum]
MKSRIISKYYILSFALMFVWACQAQTGESLNHEILSNGIEIPKEWPPRYDVPSERKEMPVPYLEDKPQVIPVNVGRQLFVDSFLIEETNLERVYHTPNFYSENPVLEPDKEWEKTIEGALYASPFSDGIWYDEIDNKFKMWYLAGAGMIHKDDKQTFYTCYAESDDGKRWAKIPQDVYSGTNIVDTCNRDAATVWLDKLEKDPAKRYKMFNVERRPKDRRWHFVLKYSTDGIHWSEGVAQSGDLYDRSSVFFNPFRDVWALSMRYSTDVSYRSRTYLENKDPETAVSFAHRISDNALDKNVVFWFTPDDKEPRHPKFPEVDPGIYNFDAIAYESIMLGFYSVWQGPENNVCAELGIQKRNELLLGYSRDGFHFARPSHDPFMAVNETEGAWNWGNMQSINGVPLIVGDSLYFYSSGRRLSDVMWDSHTSTGLATLRRDGFVSMQADQNEGFLTTEKISFDGNHLFVNADVNGGALLVEVLDEQGKPIKGFTKADCLPIKQADKTKILVSWKDKKISDLKGQAIRLKFYLTNGGLYAFWMSPWETGESRGYTAGGGPGLNPKGVDIPLKN